MKTSRLRIGIALLALVAVFPITAALAAETITYTYDALGRLVKAQSTGSVNNNQTRSLCYDPAGNRTQARSNNAGAVAVCSGESMAATIPTPLSRPQKPWFTGADEMATQARSQLVAAQGRNVTWRVEDRRTAGAINRLFKDRGIEGIKVKVAENVCLGSRIATSRAC